jgi:serine/threonine-protein kinase
MPTLASGTRLGPYEILDAVGAGGMGEVYRGRDTRLDRMVAIKVLAPGLAKDVTSRERFEREARAISSLNHPNICVLHDIGREKPPGDEAPVDFLVMEFLEGETLSARLARGPSRASRSGAASAAGQALPPMTVEEALAIAIPIAAALDCAHRQGIVHRDLKPGNVMLLSNGIVKLLDFGLARLAQTGGDKKDSVGHGMVSLADLSQPTVSSPLTVKGTILGTLQYMAPEQLEGKEVDARADIFAFGGMLYEMLTGKRPFEGKSQASLIGAILDHQPPPVTSLQPLTPAILDDVVARCLEKNPDERWQSARDLKRQLEWVAKSPRDAVSAGVAAVSTRRDSANRRVAAAAAILVVAAIAAGATAWTLWPASAPPRGTTRFSIPLAEGQQFTRAGRHAIALSPDGKRLVYVANRQLYLRAMDDLTAAVIPGTEDADPSEPVFSPDGEWVAFWSNEELKKIPTRGGTAITLASAGNPFGASWSGDRILLAQATPSGIVEVPANGGQPRLIVTTDENLRERAQSPHLIAGGRAVLFTLRVGPGVWDDAKIVVQELSTGRRKTLVEGGTDAQLLPTGHLVYVRKATLFAVPFDETRLEVSGSAVQLESGIQQAATAASGAAQWAWARTGTMAFVPGEGVASNRVLAWVTGAGQVELTSAPARAINFFPTGLRISPDGARVALMIDVDPRPTASGASGSASDIWIWEIQRNTVTRLSFNGQASSPLWTPDGSRVCYRIDIEVLCQAADGSGQALSVAKFPGLTAPKSFSPDGTRLLSTAIAPSSNDIIMTSLDKGGETQLLLHSSFNEGAPAVSPDGRWLAYASNETGISEIYVRPFPSVDRGRWQISTEGGVEPRWTRDGRTLLYTFGGGPVPRVLWSASIAPGPTFSASAPKVVTKLPSFISVAYDVAPDGRVLFHLPEASEAATLARFQNIVVVEHWFDELRARAPIAK